MDQTQLKAFIDESIARINQYTHLFYVKIPQSLTQNTERQTYITHKHTRL